MQGKQLSTDGKLRFGGRVEKHGPYPEHVHPNSGSYVDVHVQTVEDTTRAGFRKGILGVIAPFSVAVAGDAMASPAEATSAALWDLAKALDPVFATDLLEVMLGIEEPYNWDTDGTLPVAGESETKR